MNRCVEPSSLSGGVRAPASKSAMQRALACAAMACGGPAEGGPAAGGPAEGRASRITNPTWCADSLAAMEVARALGAAVSAEGDSVFVRGGFRPGSEPVDVSCGESGLCLRMFSAIASLRQGPVTLRAEGSLRRRPVGMLEEALRSLGTECATDGGLPPVRVRGPLRGGRVVVDGSESSQFLTGLLLALPMTGTDSVVSVRNLASRGYVDLTLDVMRAFGAEAERDGSFTEFRIGRRPYAPTAYDVEGDWSGAAFLLVAGAISGGGGGVRVEGLSGDSSQPDRAVLDALAMAGARVEASDGGYVVRGGALRGFCFDATQCPDLFPPLVALASRCAGVTSLRGASRLRAKETDRAAALSGEFARLGLRVDVDGDLMTVQGLGSGGRLTGGSVDARGDHRMAMAAAVAATAALASVTIEGAECVAKSWPGFFEALSSIGGRVSSWP